MAGPEPVPPAGRAAALGPGWYVQAAHIARRFHIDGRSKVEIAEETGLSRFKVARILDQARQLGMVRVTIEAPTHIDAELSSQLREVLALERVVVVRHDDPTEPVRAGLGRTAAALLDELVTPEDTLGLGCTRSVLAASTMLRPLPPCRVVQLSGTLAAPGAEGGSVESVRNAVAAGAAAGYTIYAPMLVADGTTAAALVRDTAIAETLRLIESVTLAMVSFGGWGPVVSTVWEELDEHERRDAAARGVVGEVGARMFDRDGRPVVTATDARAIGATLEQLRSIDHVIGIAHAPGRAEAVRAAARGGLLDSLVCDASLARTLVTGERR